MKYPRWLSWHMQAIDPLISAGSSLNGCPTSELSIRWGKFVDTDLSTYARLHTILEQGLGIEVELALTIEEQTLGNALLNQKLDPSAMRSQISKGKGIRRLIGL